MTRLKVSEEPLYWQRWYCTMTVLSCGRLTRGERTRLADPDDIDRQPEAAKLSGKLEIRRRGFDLGRWTEFGEATLSDKGLFVVL